MFIEHLLGGNHYAMLRGHIAQHYGSHYFSFMLYLLMLDFLSQMKFKLLENMLSP